MCGRDFVLRLWPNIDKLELCESAPGLELLEFVSGECSSIRYDTKHQY